MRLGSAIAFVAVIAVLLPGCGKSKKPVFPVSGKVLDAHDKPAVGATVVLVHIGNEKDWDNPAAEVDDSGNFQLTTYVKGDGAPAGEYTVTIFWPSPKKKPFDPPGADQLNGAYSATASKIKFTVEKKPDNQIPPIKLTPPALPGADR